MIEVNSTMFNGAYCQENAAEIYHQEKIALLVFLAKGQLCVLLVTVLWSEIWVENTVLLSEIVESSELFAFYVSIHNSMSYINGIRWKKAIRQFCDRFSFSVVFKWQFVSSTNPSVMPATGPWVVNFNQCFYFLELFLPGSLRDLLQLWRTALAKGERDMTQLLVCFLCSRKDHNQS